MNSSSRDHAQAASAALERAPLWHRFQIEIGGRWQLFPTGELNWRTWAWSPYANVAWPGKRLAYKDVPREFWKPGLIADYDNGKAAALFYWASAALRVLGLDLGVAVFYRPRRVASSAAQIPGDSSRDEVKPYEAEVGERQP